MGQIKIRSGFGIRYGETLSENVTVNENLTDALGGTISVPDIAALPLMASQPRIATAAYNALTVYNPDGSTFGSNPATSPAGKFYIDPTSGLRVWKVSDSSILSSPVIHGYSEAGPFISRAWGAGQTTHTMLLSNTNSSYRLVDIVRGVGANTGPQNYRAPSTPPTEGEQGWCFGRAAGNERIMFMHAGNKVQRFDTATNTLANTGKFGATVPSIAGGWFQCDRYDRKFAWFNGNNFYCWDSQTNVTIQQTLAGADEPYLEDEGNYVFINAGVGPSRVWNLNTNTLVSPGAPSGMTAYVHMSSPRGFFVSADTNDGPMKTYRYDPVANSWTQFTDFGGRYYPEYHTSSGWFQTDARLNSDLTKQYILFDHWPASTAGGWTLTGMYEGCGLMRLDGADFRFVRQHFSLGGDYYDEAHTALAVDGLAVTFASDMRGSARCDVFLAELPTTTGIP